MTLSEVIYEKSCHLSEDKAQEVIDFIDFLLKKSEQLPKNIDRSQLELTLEQQKAYDFLDHIRIDWQGKPIIDREDANARR